MSNVTPFINNTPNASSTTNSNATFITSSSVTNFNKFFNAASTTRPLPNGLNCSSSTAFYPTPSPTTNDNGGGMSTSFSSITFNPPPHPPPPPPLPMSQTFYNKPTGSYTNGTFTYVPPTINFHQRFPSISTTTTMPTTVNLNFINANKYAHLERFQMQQQHNFQSRAPTTNSQNGSRPNSLVMLEPTAMASSEQEYLDKGFLNLLKTKNPQETTETSTSTTTNKPNSKVVVKSKKMKNKNLIDLSDDAASAMADISTMSVFDLFDPLTIKEKSETKKKQPPAPTSSDEDDVDVEEVEAGKTKSVDAKIQHSGMFEIVIGDGILARK